MKGRTVKKQYRRVTDIDEKIKNVSLPYFHWKVLFLVLEETGIDELVKTLNSDDKTVQDALDSLEQNGILEDTDSSEEIPVEAEEEIQAEVEPIEEVTEEPVEEQEEVAAEIISETEEDIEDTITEEMEEPIAELLDEVVEEPEKESELLVEEETEQQPDEIEPEPEQALEDAIEEEFKIEDVEEKVEEKTESESDEVKLDTLEDTLEESETDEIETKEEDESTDISSFIDEIGGEEELVTEQEEMTAEEEVKEEPVVEEKPKEKLSANAKTIMVIDDSIVIRKMVEIALEDGDYNIVTSNSGKDGLNLLDEENPDLVIVDMTLPDMNGIDLLKTVKASKGIPVIMLSGKDAPQLIESAKSAGADDFLPKPFRDDDLIEKVKNLTK